MATAGGSSGFEPGRRDGRGFPAIERMRARKPRREVVGFTIAVAGTIALTAAVAPMRSHLTPLSIGFGYLIVVAVSAATGGLWPGLLASFLGFVTFNFFFLPPYDTFVIGRPEYVVVLFVFLGLSILISALLARAADRAQAAEARENELRILQDLSAGLVALRPGPDAYSSVVSNLLGTFGLTAGALFVNDPQTHELREDVTVGEAPASLGPRTDLSGDGPALERLPLSVGGRSLGLVVLRMDRDPFTAEESRVIRAFCDQFALVLERDRLLREATRSQVYEQADEVRRSLLAAVSHDLRTPIAAIKTSVTDLLSDDSPQSGEYAHEVLESIDRETDRLAALVANLLDMSRIERGMLKARAQGVDLLEVASAVADRVRRQYPDLVVRVAIDPAGSIVRADPVFLERVIANLMDNAARATRESGGALLEVEGRRMGPDTVLRVIDHGKGVPWNIREQLFYPFFQMEARHPRLGTGLGLPICKGFLSLMGGEIWVENTPGGGATFAFSIPTETSAAVHAHAVAGSAT